jgi:abortive infection bacteriophage resistance protein
MIYILSHRHGPFWYTNPAVFKDVRKFAITLSKIKEEHKRSDEIFITDFNLKYSDPLPPSWIMLEITSFGSLSMLFKNLKQSLDKRDIAHFFGLDDTTFASWLHSIVYIRNVCAHHSRVWSRIMRISPRIPISPINPWITLTTVPDIIPGNPPVKINNRTYYLLSMIIYLLNTINPNHTFKNRFYQLLKKYKMIDVNAMGFPNGWETESLWNWQKVVKDEKWHNRILKKIRLK